MSPQLHPSESSREQLPYQPNPNGMRIFRVTDRIMDQRTRLIIADSPESAIADDASAISELAHEKIHEVVECIEYQPLGMAWQSPAERIAP